MSFKANDSLAEQIAHHIGEQIISGDLVEGERIQEMRVVGELEVSRGAVREALLILQRRHLVNIYPRRGAVVSELTPPLVKSLYDMVVLLLGYTARRMADSWRQDELAPFMARMDELRTLVDEQDIGGFYESSFELLRDGHRFAVNPYLAHTLTDLQPSVRRAYYLALQVSKRELEESYGYLRGAMDAVMLRQPDKAAELVEEFVLHQRNLVLESLLRVKQIEMAWARRHRR